MFLKDNPKTWKRESVIVQGQYDLHRRPKKSTDQCLEKENLARLLDKRLYINQLLFLYISEKELEKWKDLRCHIVIIYLVMTQIKEVWVFMEKI